MLVGGDFTTVNGLAKPHLVRLTQTGAVDPSFSSAAGTVSSIALLPNGYSYIG